MNYYQHHIGDYTTATVHLSPMEDLTYRRLLDMYYHKEQPIPTDIPSLSRRLRVDEKDVETVLSEFFELTDEGWRNARCDEEIESYYAYIQKQRDNGKKGGRPQKEPKKTHRLPTANPPITQAKPKKSLTTTQEPITKEEENAPPSHSSVAIKELNEWFKEMGAPLTVNQIKKWQDAIGRVAAETDFTVEMQAAAFKWARDRGLKLPKANFWREDIVDWAATRKAESTKRASEQNLYEAH